MILSIPLQPGTLLASVRYRWIVGGVEQGELSVGVSQPDLNFPLFLFDVIPPANAEEIIAYDVADLSNWNVGQYELFVGSGTGTAPGPPVIIPPFPAPPGLRTVNFKGVYESILRRHGLDPLVSTEHDVLRAVVEHINDRVGTAWSYWEWPQLQMFQQRAFRTVWTDTTQFYSFNFEGVPDELYNPSDTLYYRVKPGPNPPPGTIPTNSTYFEPFTLTDRYILIDQQNAMPIGDMIAVFDTDPRINQYHYASKLPFRPLDREINITWAGTGPTVWILFRPPASEFTMIPYMDGKTYNEGDTIFHPDDGECYRANQNMPTGDPTGQSTQWTKVPFPAIFRRYVVAGAYADGLRETDPVENDPVKLQIRDTKIQIADTEATDFLQQEIDRLITAGQTYRYGEFNPVRVWHGTSRYW